MAITVNGRLTATGYAACMKCKGLRAKQKEIYRCSNEREVHRVGA